MVKVLCYKLEGRWFDPSSCQWIFHWHKSYRLHYGPGVDSASNRNEYREYFLGVKSGRCVPPSCAVVMKSGSLNFLEPCGPVQACNGTALPLCFVYIKNVYYVIPLLPVPLAMKALQFSFYVASVLLTDALHSSYNFFYSSDLYRRYDSSHNLLWMPCYLCSFSTCWIVTYLKIYIYHYVICWLL